jgi:hypothetical protein
VARAGDATREAGIRLHPLAGEEERRLDVRSVEDGQQLPRGAELPALVEGEVDDLVAPRSDPQGVVAAYEACGAARDARAHVRAVRDEEPLGAGSPGACGGLPGAGRHRRRRGRGPRRGDRAGDPCGQDEREHAQHGADLTHATSVAGDPG